MDDLIGNMYAVCRIKKSFHINGLLTEPHGDLIKCMISRRDPLEFWSQALGGHLTNSSLEYWCRSPLLSSQPCFITKSASWKPDSSLMRCQPLCGPVSLRWVTNIGSDCGSQRGGGVMLLRDPQTLPSLCGGGHFKLSDKLWTLPLSSLASVSFTHCLLCQTMAFSSLAFAQGAFLRFMPQSHVYRDFLWNQHFSALFNIIPVVQTWVRCYNVLFFNVSCGSHYQRLPSEWIGSCPQFSQIFWLGTSYLPLSWSLSLLPAVLSWKEAKWQVTGNLDENSGSRLRICRSPRGSVNSQPWIVHEIWRADTFFRAVGP